MARQFNLTERQRSSLVSALQDYRHCKSITKLCESIHDIYQNKGGSNSLLNNIRKHIQACDTEEFDMRTKDLLVHNGEKRSKSISFHLPKHQSSAPLEHQRSQTEPIILKQSSVNNEGKGKRLNYMKNQYSLPSKTDIYSPIKPNSKCFTLSQDLKGTDDLGFSICGGSQCSKLIYVSHVTELSQASDRGLMQGDELIEVNGVSLQGVKLVDAARLIKSLKVLNIVVRRNKQSVEWKGLKSLSPWAVVKQKESMFKLTNKGPSRPPSTEGCLSNSNVRTVELTPEPNKTLGFNVRGGSEYGIGIYVTKVIRNSLAEKKGLKKGDRIVEANGKSFESITNTLALKFLKTFKTAIVLKVIATGKIPEGKHLVEEYTWLTLDGERVLSRPGTPDDTVSTKPSVAFPEPPDFDVDFPVDEYSVNAAPSSTPQKKDLYGTPSFISTTPAQGHNNNIFNNNTRNRTDNLGLMGVDKSNLRQPIKTSSLNDLSKIDDLSLKSLNIKKFGSVGNVSRKKSFLRKQQEKVQVALSWNKKKARRKDRSLFNSSLFDESDDRLDMLDAKLQNVLTVHEYKNVKEYLADYLRNGDIDAFTSHLIASLNTPGKHDLIAQMRNIVFPYEVAKFNSTTEHSTIGPSTIEHSTDRDSTEKESPTNEMRFFPFGKSYKKSHRLNKDNQNISGTRNDGRLYPVKTLKEYSNGRSHSNSHHSIMTVRQVQNGPLQHTELPAEDFNSFFRSEEGFTRSKSNVNISYATMEPDNNGHTYYDKPYSTINAEGKKNIMGIKTINSKISLTSTADVNRALHKSSGERYYNSASEVLEGRTGSWRSSRSVEHVPKLLFLKSRSYGDISEPTVNKNISKNRNVTSQDAESISSQNAESFIAYDIKLETSNKKAISISNVKINKRGQKKQTNRQNVTNADIVHSNDDDMHDALTSPTKAFTTVRFLKNFDTLGLSITGGSESQPDITIAAIHPNSSASHTSIKVGDLLVSLNGESLMETSHQDAVTVIRNAFNDKTHPYMEFVVMKD